MDQWQHGYGGRGGDAGRSDGRLEGRGGARAAIQEIDTSLERLERTCREGKITPDELAEVREVLEAERRRVTRSP
jgi:hypothetical protein